jgi:hypothetical protein
MTPFRFGGMKRQWNRLPHHEARTGLAIVVAL